MLHCGKWSSESPSIFFFFLTWFGNYRLEPHSFGQDVLLKHEFVRGLRALIGFNVNLTSITWSPHPHRCLEASFQLRSGHPVLASDVQWMDLCPAMSLVQPPGRVLDLCYSLVSSTVFVLNLLIIPGCTMDLIHVCAMSGTALAPCYQRCCTDTVGLCPGQWGHGWTGSDPWLPARLPLGNGLISCCSLPINFIES